MSECTCCVIHSPHNSQRQRHKCQPVHPWSLSRSVHALCNVNQHHTSHRQCCPLVHQEGSSRMKLGCQSNIVMCRIIIIIMLIYYKHDTNYASWYVHIIKVTGDSSPMHVISLCEYNGVYMCSFHSVKIL